MGKDKDRHINSLAKVKTTEVVNLIGAYHQTETKKEFYGQRNKKNISEDFQFIYSTEVLTKAKIF